MPADRQTDDELRSTVRLANRMLANEGILEGFGHVTARIPGESRAFVSVAQSPLLVEDDHIVTVPLEGDLPDDLQGEMYSELPLHLAIYRHRPDVNCVVHHHAPEVMPFACSDRDIKPMGKVGAIFADGVPRFDDYDLTRRGRLVVGREESDRMAEQLGEHTAQLLDGHGANVVASTIEGAVYATVRLVENAEYQWRAAAFAERDGFVDPIESTASTIAASAADRLWDHLREKLLRSTGSQQERSERRDGVPP